MCCLWDMSHYSERNKSGCVGLSRRFFLAMSLALNIELVAVPLVGLPVTICRAAHVWCSDLQARRRRGTRKTMFVCSFGPAWGHIHGDEALVFLAGQKPWVGICTTGAPGTLGFGTGISERRTPLQKEQPFDKVSLISSIELPFARSTPELQQPIASSSWNLMLPCFDGDQLMTAEKLNHETEVINKVIFNKGN